MIKFLRFVKYVLLAILGVVLLVTGFIYISSQFFIGSQDQKFKDYLKSYQEEISDKVGGKLFDADFLDSQIFLFGEVHGYADNQRVDQSLLKFLNQKAGVRYYVAEMDSINSDKLHRFLLGNTKDGELLKDVVAAMRKRIPQQSSKELLEKWNAIYDYNQTLKDSLKICVLGVDTDFSNNSPKVTRDSAMMENFTKSLKKMHIENEKFYGLFGFYHVLQCGPNGGKKPFAERLKNEGFKVKSIVSYTLESEMYLPQNPQFPTPKDQKISWINADGPIMSVKGMNDVKDLLKPFSINLFKLDAGSSPYKTSDKLISIKSRIFGENFVPVAGTSTLDYFQYIVLIKNSKALTALE